MYTNRSAREEVGTNEVNLTPLIDVSLVLVVILLLATPLAFESSIAVRDSSRAGRTAPRTDEEARVEITVESDDLVEINRHPVAREEVGETLKPIFESGNSRRVVVTCADDVSHGVFVNVLDQAKLSGADDIAVMGR